MEKPVVPVIENIHQKVYAAASQPGALNMKFYHCGTAHCRAGWVIHLAGDAGYSLENVYDFASDAALDIYAASSPIPVSIGMFASYMPNHIALADMKRCAEEEIALNAQ